MMCVFNKFIHLCMHERSQSFITPPKPISLLQHVVGGHDDLIRGGNRCAASHFFFAARSTPCGPFLIVISAHVGTEVSVLITVAFYVNEMDEGELGHDEHVI